MLGFLNRLANRRAATASNGSAASKARVSPSVSQRVEYGALGPRVTTLGYRAAQMVRRSGRPLALPGSADSHLRYDLKVLRAESQAFDRDNGIYQAMITRALDCILGSGVTLQAQTSSSGINDRIEKLWREWWTEPEIRGMDDGTAVERLILRHLFVDGDLGIIKDQKSGLIQLIEGERIDSRQNRAANGNQIEQGVELDRFGRPLAFHIMQYEQSGQTGSAAVRVVADDMIFLANRLRISQTRGAPLQQCNFAMFHRINDVCDSEAIAWQMLSRMAVAIIRKDAGEGGYEGSSEDDKASDQDIATRYHDIGEAIIFHGEPGEDIHGIERNIPGSSFPDSIKMFLRLLGLPFGFSLEFVLLIWSDTNYSSGRASIKQVERACKPWANLFKRRAMRPILQWKIRQWINEGKLPRRRDILNHEWHVPPYPFIDPQKEAQAQRMRFENGITSPTKEAKEMGLDLAELIAEQERDVSTIMETVNRLNLQFPDAHLTLGDFTGFISDKSGVGGGKGQRGMQNIARAVKSGVSVTEAEARTSMGLTPEPPAGAKLLSVVPGDEVEEQEQEAETDVEAPS